jgi:hypothetical protein
MLTLTSHPRSVPSTSQGSLEDNIVNKMSSSQTPFSQDGLEDNFTSQKRLLRQLDERVVRQKVTKSMVREAIKLYDLEKSYKGQSLEALSELERLFKINDIEWPSEDFRMAMISKKVSISLRRILKSYGCVNFFYPHKDKGYS